MSDYFGIPLAPLPSQFEITVLIPGEHIAFRVLQYALGTKLIHVGTSKRPIDHLAIGLHVERLGPKAGTHDYAFTSRNLVTSMEPFLAAGLARDHTFELRSHGPKGAKHYELAVIPPEA